MPTPTHDGVLSFGLEQPAEPANPEPVERKEFDDVQEFARSAQAPAHLRRVQSNIDNGFYTWDDVVAGKVDDPTAHRLKQDLDRFSLPYRQIGRWAEHGRDWAEIEPELSELITGPANGGQDILGIPGVLIIQPPDVPSLAREPSMPWLVDAHSRSLLLPAQQNSGRIGKAGSDALP